MATSPLMPRAAWVQRTCRIVAISFSFTQLAPVTLASQTSYRPPGTERGAIYPRVAQAVAAKRLGPEWGKAVDYAYHQYLLDGDAVHPITSRLDFSQRFPAGFPPRAVDAVRRELGQVTADPDSRLKILSVNASDQVLSIAGVRRGPDGPAVAAALAHAVLDGLNAPASSAIPPGESGMARPRGEPVLPAPPAVESGVVTAAEELNRLFAELPINQYGAQLRQVGNLWGWGEPVIESSKETFRISLWVQVPADRVQQFRGLNIVLVEDRTGELGPSASLTVYYDQEHP